MMADEEDYLTTKWNEEISKPTNSDMRKSIAISSELDDLFNDIMDENDLKQKFLGSSIENREPEIKPIENDFPLSIRNKSTKYSKF